MSTAERWVTVSKGQRLWKRPSLDIKDIALMKSRLKAKLGRKYIRGAEIIPNSNGAVVCIVPGGMLQDQLAIHDPTYRDGVAEMVARLVTPRLWRFDHHVWLDEGGTQPLLEEVQKRGLIGPWVRDHSRVWFLELHLFPKKPIFSGRFIFDPKTVKNPLQAVSFNYDAWFVPVRQDDLDKDGKLLQGRGREILRRHALQELSPLFAAHPVFPRETGRSVRKDDVMEIIWESEILKKIGDKRLEGLKRSDRPSVSLFAIMQDARVAPRKSIRADNLIRMLNWMDPEVLSAFYEMWQVSAAQKGMPMIQYERKSDIYRAARGRTFSLRTMQILAFMMNDTYRAKQIKADWNASGIAPLGSMFESNEAINAEAYWKNGVIGLDDSEAKRAYEQLPLIDQLLASPCIEETHPKFYRSYVLPDLTGRRI